MSIRGLGGAVTASQHCVIAKSEGRPAAVFAYRHARPRAGVSDFSMIKSALLNSMAILLSSTSKINLAPAVCPPIRQKRWGAGLCTEGRRVHPCALSPCLSWFWSWCRERRRKMNLMEEIGHRLVCGGASHATFDADYLHTRQARAW